MGTEIEMFFMLDEEAEEKEKDDDYFLKGFIDCVINFIKENIFYKEDLF